MVGDPKVTFWGSQTRSSEAAKAHIRGAHPWVVRSDNFWQACHGAKEFSAGDLGPPRV